MKKWSFIPRNGLGTCQKSVDFQGRVFLTLCFLIDAFIFGCAGSGRCERALPVCGEQGLLSGRGSSCWEHRPQGPRLSRCAGRLSAPSTWDLPRPGTEPVSPALAGRLSTPGPPGGSQRELLLLFSGFLFSSTGPCVCPHGTPRRLL